MTFWNLVCFNFLSTQNFFFNKEHVSVKISGSESTITVHVVFRVGYDVCIHYVAADGMKVIWQKRDGWQDRQLISTTVESTEHKTSYQPTDYAHASKPHYHSGWVGSQVGLIIRPLGTHFTLGILQFIASMECAMATSCLITTASCQHFHIFLHLTTGNCV